MTAVATATTATPAFVPGRAVADALLGWFRQSHRELPWRTAPSPYKTLVSELMLQQTGVAVVVPYFERFLGRFPDLAALAAASEGEVAAAWSGLGYYARARNLHRAARAVMAEHGGALPAEESALRELPGIGPYTAAAVAAIAFGEHAFALDGNAARVVARLCGIEAPIDAPEVRAELRAIGLGWVPRRGSGDGVSGSGDFAEAVMELGATVCRPRQPACVQCPVAHLCRAAMSGRAHAIPVKTARAPKRALSWAAVRIWARGHVALARRQEGLLAGTWMLPVIQLSQLAPPSPPSPGSALGSPRSPEPVDGGGADPWPAEAEPAVRAWLAAHVEPVSAAQGPGASRPRFVGTVRHVFTHRVLSVELFELHLARRARLGTPRSDPPGPGGPLGHSGWRWVEPARPSGLALSSLARKLLAL
jgi:A/G-specific adenine glycosylase